MNALLPATEAQVRARVRSLLRRAKESRREGQEERRVRFVGLRAHPAWPSSKPVRVEGQEVPVVPCPSPLAIREAMVTHANPSGPVVLLTDQDESALGQDVLARLERHQLLDLDVWQVVRDLFDARSLDRRLVSSRWIAEALIDAAPDEGYPPLTTGVLDLDTAWRHLLRRRFQLPSASPSLADVLRWAQVRGRAELLARETPEGLAALRERLLQTAGLAAGGILAAVEAGAAHRVIGLGLACRVVADPSKEHDPVLREAFVRLERFQGEHALTSAAAQAWADAAEDFVREELAVSQSRARPWLAAGEAALADLKASDRAYLSDFLRIGLDQRLTAWGAALGQALASDPPSVDDTLEAAADLVARHALAADAEGQAVTMALRLVRWLAARSEDPSTPASFPEAVSAYVRDGGFVDWARSRIWDQGQASELRQAYSDLLARVDAIRSADDETFGKLLADWSAHGSEADQPLPLERVLECLVGPLAQEVPTLLVVMDGMSQAVFRELEADLYTKGWIRLRSELATQQGPALAVFPTVTEVCRATLLCGRLASGTQQVEQAEFPKHPALLKASEAKKPPQLFHKAQLTSSSGLSDALHAALEDEDQRVVGVVINAVDDHLMKGDQLPVRWTAEQARPLDAILTAARHAKRAVVLTADHGHVVDRGTSFESYPDAKERFRPGDGPPAGDLEVQLKGSRVSDRYGSCVIAPWSDRLRYSQGKRHGYHGGAAPAEVVVPLSVFTGSPLPIEGWTETPLIQPEWWSTAEPELPVVARPAPEPRPKRPAETPGPLFAQVEMPEATTEPEVEEETPAKGDTWLDALFESEVFLSQHQRAGRSAPSVERIRAALGALEARGGTLTQAALAKKLSLPALRMGGVLAGFRRVLNVEGYRVLAVEDGSVVFNRELAAVQFGVEL